MATPHFYKSLNLYYAGLYSGTVVILSRKVSPARESTERGCSNLKYQQENEKGDRKALLILSTETLNNGVRDEAEKG